MQNNNNNKTYGCEFIYHLKGKEACFLLSPSLSDANNELYKFKYQNEMQVFSRKVNIFVLKIK